MSGWRECAQGLDIPRCFAHLSPSTRTSLANWSADKLDLQLVEDVLEHLCSMAAGGTGAVLIFLTGWDEISNLTEALKGNRVVGNSAKFLVLPLHSSMPTVTQKQIFCR